MENGGNGLDCSDEDVGSGGDMHAGTGGIENGIEDGDIGMAATTGSVVVGPGGARFITRAAAFACAAGDLTPGRR